MGNCGKRKVAFVVSSMNTGGAQRMVSNIITHFPEEWDIDLILNSSENMVYPYIGNVIDLGIREPVDRESLIYQWKVFIKRIKILRKLKKKNQYAAVISFLDSANIANILTGNRYCKTIISVRVRLSGASAKVYKLIVNNLVKMLYNHADMVVAISDGVKEDLLNNFHVLEEKLCTIYNGFDVKNIRHQTSCGTIDQRIQEKIAGKTVIINAARMVPQKGQWHLIKAFSLIVDKFENLRLMISGDGTLEEILKNLCIELGIEDKVIFTGFLDNPFPIYKQSSLFVFSSIYEGFGNALVEAMICGLPCIATDFKFGAREILDPKLDIFEDTDRILYGEYGVITPNCEDMKESLNCHITNNERILAKAMEEMLKNDKLREHYSKKAEERVENFNIENTVKEWILLIDQGK